MLKTKNLTKKFWRQNKEFIAVNNLSIEVKKGEVFGFIGLNGAGKTTTIKMVTGLLFADEGLVKIKSFDSNSVKTKQLFGFMPEQPQFYHHLSAEEILRYTAELFEIEEEKITPLVKTLIKKVGLAGNEKTQVKDFSKGMRQRLGFAVALVNNPELLILDEPLDGLDPIGRAEFKKLIKEQKSKGKTVFLSSHILADINEICDRIAVIDKGRLLFLGKPKELTKSKETLEDAFVKLVTK